MGGFPWPFSKSLVRNVLVEYAVLVSQLLVEDSPLQLRGWSTKNIETRSLSGILWSCIVGRQIVPTGHILLVIGLGALTIPKALNMSSSHAINSLKHHYLDFPANRPDMSDPVRAWKPSIAEVRLCPNLLYTGWTGVFLFKLPFPVRKLMLQGRLGYISPYSSAMLPSWCRKTCAKSLHVLILSVLGIASH